MDLFDDFREVSLLPFILPKQNGYSVLWNVDLNGFEIKLPNGELFYSPNFFNKKPDEYILEREKRLELSTPTLARLCSTN